MTKKNKWYLVLSIIVFMLTFVAIFQNFETIHFIGFETKIIWIPIWIAVVILPLLNLYEIAINTEESNYYYWLSLLINIVTILFMIRYFKLELLP
jgi:hypothetical protein